MIKFIGLSDRNEQVPTEDRTKNYNKLALFFSHATIANFLSIPSPFSISVKSEFFVM